LNLSADDIIIIDRPSFFEYVQPLFSEETRAKIVVFLHSGHYFYPGESDNALYLNFEYYYWFKYVNRISLFIVSTEEQKKDLICRFNEYECKLPRIEVIPISGLKKPEHNKKRMENSILTVSRLALGKKIEWIIEAVVQARKRINNLTLDIYGDGNPGMIAYLAEYVRKNNAEEYIHFMGFCEMEQRYQDYELYVTASVFETLGLSVMEAVGSGNAIIGLNTRYGNRLFIEDGKNGRLIDFCPADSKNPEKVKCVINEMADAIVEIFEDREKLESYQEYSYKIAEDFLNEKIEKRWLEVLETL